MRNSREIQSRTGNVSHPKALARSKLPFDVSVKSTNIYSPWDVDTLSEIINVLQWTLDTIKDGAHDARPQLYREGLPRSEDGVTD